MPFATRTSTISGTFASGVPTGAAVTANGTSLVVSNFRTTILSGTAATATGLFSADVVLPAAGTVGLTVAPLGTGGVASSPFTARVRPASEAYQVPAAIPLGIMPHSALPSGGIIASWPGFERSHLGPNQRLIATVDGAQVYVQQDGESHWANGNVRAARVCFRLPAALPANVEKRLTVAVAAGAPDRTPWITVAQILAQPDFTLNSFGGEAGAAVFVTSLHDIMQNFPRDAWGDNPLGGWDTPVSGPCEVIVRAWRYRRDSVGGGIDQWRRDVIYVTFRVDGTWEFAARVEQPNYDGPVAGATLGGASQSRMVCAFEAFQGGTRIAAWGGLNDPRTRTVPATSFTASNTLAYGAVPGLEFGMCVMVAAAAGGTLPSGLAANTPYWMANAGSGLSFWPARSVAAQSGAAAPPSFGTAGTGNIVVTPMVSTFCFSGPLLCAADGQAVRVGGAGRVDIGIAWDEEYMSRGAKLWPRYDQAFTRYPSLGPAAPYYPQTLPWGFWLNTTGDNPGDNRIGFLNHNALQALLSPYDTGYQQTMRRDAAAWSDQPIWVGDTSGGRLLVSDFGPDDAGGRYPGMGVSRRNKAFNGYMSSPAASVNFLGGGGPNSSGYFDGYSSAQMDGSHMPCPWPVAAHMTGHPMFADMGMVQANSVQLFSNSEITLGSQTYFNIVGYGEQLRGAGWVLRAYGLAEAFTPTLRPEAAVITRALDRMAQWGAHAVTLVGPAELKMGRVGHVDRDVGFFYGIWMLALLMEVWRGDRPAMRTYAAAQCNQLLGAMNDSRADGGTTYVLDTYSHPNCANAAGVTYPSIRAMLAAEGDFGNVTFPVPATGFQGGSHQILSAFNTVRSSVQMRAAVVMAASAGMMSLTGDDAGAVYDLVQARLNTPPCIGLAWSAVNWGSSSFAGNTSFPASALVPG